MRDAITTSSTLLRTVADVLDRLDLPDDVHVIADVSVSPYESVTPQCAVSVHCSDLDQLRQARRAVGRMAKRQGTAGMLLDGEVDGIKVTVWPPHDVCRQVQVGTEVRPVTKVVETDEVEEIPVYEWDCGPVLADEQVPA